MSVHFLSQSVDWATPKGVYDELDREFHFDFDPCPLMAMDAIDYWNGLTGDWKRSNFVNPPYGREIGKWTAKAVEEWKKGRTVVLLIPSRTDTIWWHRDIMSATEIRFIKGRLKFGDATNSAPFPSAVVVFRGMSAFDTSPWVTTRSEFNFKVAREAHKAREKLTNKNYGAT